MLTKNKKDFGYIIVMYNIVPQVVNDQQLYSLSPTGSLESNTSEIYPGKTSVFCHKYHIQ
jgi:hypothetical protein